MIKEINCRDCNYFDKENKKCSIEKGSPIRKCVIAINKNIVKNLDRSEKGLKILEIGCGVWSYVKNNLPDNLEWEGIDIIETDKKGRKTIATKIGSVEKIFFEAIVLIMF